MHRLLRLIAFSTALVPSLAQTIPLSRKQVRDVVKAAHTQEQHAQAAALLRQQEKWYRQKEAEQRAILAEYYRTYQNQPAKYPTRGDQARQFATHCGLEARHAADLAQAQEDLAHHSR